MTMPIFRFSRMLSAGEALSLLVALLLRGFQLALFPLESPFFAPINGASYKMNEVMDMMTKNQTNERRVRINKR